MKLTSKIFKNKYFKAAVTALVIVAVVGGSFYFGYKRGEKNPQTVVIQGVTNIEQGKETPVDFSIFWEAWNLVKEKYVNAGNLKDQDLVYGAISGLLGALKDPNTIYFPPSDAKKFGEDLSGEFSGIGAEIGIQNGQLVVIAPLKDTPAEKSGLRSGDAILKINDTIVTSDMTVEDAVKLIRGPKGTKVTLSILRGSWQAPKEISIVRDTITPPTIDWKMEDGGIAYIHIYNFYENAPYAFYKTAVDIAFQNAKGTAVNGIVLDLRDNPGGFLDASVNIAGWFLDRGKLVTSEQYRSGPNDAFKASGNGLFKDIPIVVLVNQGSASASEILAGALRDDRGAKLVGTRSFGKGTVQEIENLKDGSLAKITIAHWVTPSGVIIDKNGLKPDYEVKLSDDDIKNKKDPQLDKALEVIKQEIK